MSDAPTSAAAAAIATMVGGLMVETTTITVPGWIPSKAPPSPVSTAST